MISIQDEKKQDWIILDDDLDPDTLRALSHLGINKSETRIWRDYVYSGFINRPNPDDAFDRLEGIIQTITEKKSSEVNVSVLSADNELIGHALMAYTTIVALENRLERIKKEKESAEYSESIETGSEEE